VIIFGGLKRNAIYRANSTAKIAGNASLFAVGAAREYNASSPPGRYLPLSLGIKDCFPLSEGVKEDRPNCP
jgi:hypothetical protein